MDRPAYQQGVLMALFEQEFTKVALPLWAYPAAAGLGALGGAALGETPGIGALQGAVLAPATLLGGHAAWRHMAKASPAMRGLVAGAGGAAAGLGIYGLGSTGLGSMADVFRAPGRAKAEQERQQQLMQLRQAQQAESHQYYY